MADQPEGMLPPAGFFNIMRISSTSREVYFDLGQHAPGQDGVGHILGRFVTTPDHFREMVRVMTDHLQRLDAARAEAPTQ
jgi:hypothetical protein